MTVELSKHHTQWAATFAAASELSKMGYGVALTLGNHPVKDLMVESPGGVLFSVDVKGQRTTSNWRIRKRELRSDLFYILVYVPPKEANMFFILTHNEALALMEAATNRWRVRNNKPADEPDDDPIVTWPDCQQFKDKWEKLPK